MPEGVGGDTVGTFIAPFTNCLRSLWESLGMNALIVSSCPSVAEGNSPALNALRNAEFSSPKYSTRCCPKLLRPHCERQILAQ